ncbi:MAG: N-acetylmuramoyl-L-alanine amidase family protein [Gemmatimonadales bacterium]
MIAHILVLLLATPPGTVRIATPRGETSVPVRWEQGAAVAAPLLAGPLGLVVVIEGARATVVLDGVGFVFAVGSPYARVGSRFCQLVDESYVVRDTLFLPLVWLTDCVPRVFGSRFRWDPILGLLTETGDPTVVVRDTAPVAGVSTSATPVPVLPPPRPVPVAPATVRPAPHPLTGLHQRHAVVIDPGHGGRDPGNPGRFFPEGTTEKDVNLFIARLLRAELIRRGIAASLTRTGDTLIDLRDRAGYCRDDCDLFVSIHVNAMPAGRRAPNATGVETYFLSDAKTEDQRRVMRMENDAIRFEATDVSAREGDLATILKDLRQNEYLRESARLAELVQQRVAGVHPGEDRGVQQAGFYVLNSARKPAILVETGFSTNKRDGAFLTSTLGQRKIAHAIADGVVSYLLDLERKLAVGGNR